MAGILGVLAALFGTSASAQVAQGIKAYARGDYPAAMRAFEAGAAKGDPQALYNLGVAYAEGRAVPADPARALDYYRQAAEGGSVLAAFNLGQAYRKGQGVAADPAQAARAAQALAACLRPGEFLLARTRSAVSLALFHACAAGLMSQGVQVLDAGVCTLPQLRYALKAFGADGAALVGSDSL